MKYGKNQWARIASLLHKKSSKQCKARWLVVHVHVHVSDIYAADVHSVYMAIHWFDSSSVC